jgi:hypothetical protein
MALPGDFGGRANLVLVAFQRGQQADVDTWFAQARTLAAAHEELRWYEVPTLGAGWRPMRGWIDGGMRAGIPDTAQRARTVTLYPDKGPFRAALGIGSEATIHPLLLDRDGHVIWRTQGPWTIEKGASLARAVVTALEPRETATAHASASTASAAPASVAAVAEPGSATRRSLVLEALRLGVPLYNAGDAAGCAAVYETAARALLLMDPSLDPAARRDLESALTHSAGGAAVDRAWTLRRVFDRLLSAASA